MDKNVAQIIAMTAARCSSEIGGLAVILKEHCTGDEYKEIALALGSAVYELRAGLMGKVFQFAPGLEKEFEDRLEKYGRSYY